MQAFISVLLKDRIQARLLLLAGLFLGLYSIALTLSPIVRFRSFDEAYRWQHWLGFLVWLCIFAVAYYQVRHQLPKSDPYILPVVALLSGWGLLTIWRLYPDFGLRQTIWMIVSIVVFILGVRFAGLLSFLRRYKYLWLTTGLLLTALTLVLGTNPMTGSSPRLWLGCCGVYFQPSEPLKLLLIIYLAAYFADRQLVVSVLPPGESDSGRAIRSSETSASGSQAPLLPLIAPTLLMIGVTLLLLLVQRDLGTVIIFIFLFSIITYLATGRGLILLVSLLVIGLAGVAGYVLFEVVSLRVDSWLNPWLDPSGRSYQIVQSLLAVANGGLVGRGPGLGNPILVPVAHSDFIFAAIVEEGGLLGAFGLVLLLAILVTRGLRVALRAPDVYQRLLAGGLVAYLIAQSILIAGGNLRLLPLTGVTLPFVSYGGSSLLTAFVSLLILLKISQQSESRPAYLPGTRPYLVLGALLLGGLVAIAIVLGWWGYYRGPALLERTDNARRSISDRFVPRGDLFDRDDSPLTKNSGTTGDLTREYLYPQLSPVVGYNHPVYGQSGLEETLDPYLRGLRGNPVWTIWWNHLLYGQPPAGVDVRLSLDLDLQEQVDAQLGDRRGAAILLNAETGEVLAMASHPAFDPNQLDETWEELVADPLTPLLDRAVLGQYQAGAAIAPFLLAAATEQAVLPAPSESSILTIENLELNCALPVGELTWSRAVAAGCSEVVGELEKELGTGPLEDLYQMLEISPQESGLAVSPMQMALAAATLSSAGSRPTPQLASAFKAPLNGWSRLSEETISPETVFSPAVAARLAGDLAQESLPIWQSLAVSPNGPDQWVSWYLGGTLPTWEGAPLALVVLLEEDNPQLAESIGHEIFRAAMPAK